MMNPHEHKRELRFRAVLSAGCEVPERLELAQA